MTTIETVRTHLGQPQGWRWTAHEHLVVVSRRSPVAAGGLGVVHEFDHRVFAVEEGRVRDATESEAIAGSPRCRPSSAAGSPRATRRSPTSASACADAGTRERSWRSTPFDGRPKD